MLTVEKVFGVGAWRQRQTIPRRRFGVPVGGPWDCEASELALALLRKEPREPVFEVLVGTAELRAREAGTISAVGTDGMVSAGTSSLPLGVRLPVGEGDLIRVHARCAYVAWTSQRLSQARLDWRSGPIQALRYLASQSDADAYEVVVSPVSSRAGMRLTGLSPTVREERPSEPCCVGAIQQTPGGELIIIGPDGPTIGGYSRLGTVIEADLNLIPRLEIGSKIQIVPITLDNALKCGSEARERSFSILKGLRANGS